MPVARVCDERELKRLYGICVRCGDRVRKTRDWWTYDHSRKIGECRFCYEGRYEEETGVGD